MTLKFALRSLGKRPLLNFIRIFGLSLSLSSVLLIILYLKNELTFENFNKNAGRIYRLTTISPSDERQFAKVLNTSFVPLMPGRFPDIEKYVRLIPVNGGLIRYNNEFFSLNEGFECDSTFIDIFGPRLLTGDPEGILDAPGSMILSESYSKKIFGKEDPVGKILTVPAGQFYGNNTDYTVKGVMRDFPQNSHFHPEFITTPVDRSVFDGWGWIYLQLSRDADPGKINAGFREFIAEISASDPKEIKIDSELQKITDIHLRSGKQREIEENSSLSVIRTLATASLILLIIALANYSNLNMAMAGFSEKYLFVSKVSGSSGFIRSQFFLTEGLVILAISTITGIFISSEANAIILKRFSLDLFTGNALLIVAVILIFGLLTLLAGIIPVMKWSDRVMTLTDLMNKEKLNRKSLSRVMIVLQYAVSTALIIAVIVIIRQTNYALKSTMGGNNSTLICFRNVHSEIQSKFTVFKQELLKNGSVEMVSAMLEPPGGEASDKFEFKMEGYVPDQNDKSDNYIGVFPVDYSFASVFKLPFISGSNFSEKNEDNEGSGEYIINESAVRRLKYSNPADIIGKEFRLITNIPTIDLPEGRIIGVVKDFHLKDIKNKVEPLVMFKRKDLWLINFIVSFQPEMKDRALADIEKVWNDMFPGYPFQYEYLDSIYQDVYGTELLESALLTIFTVIALFICSMGLLGMSLLSTSKRIKEIGLRKINGAGRNELMVMMNSDMLKWIILAYFIAVPVAFIAMERWLGNFAYKTDLSWWIFILSGIASFAIALMTVSVQTWKTANTNPVEALRYE